MSLTITRKLSLQVLALISMTLFIGGFAYFKSVLINQSIVQLIGHYEPVSTAGYEMEINMIGTGLGALSYLVDPRPEHLARIQKDREDFKRFWTTYHDLVETESEKSLANKIHQDFERFQLLALRLVERRTHIDELKRSVHQLISDLERNLDRTIERHIALSSANMIDSVHQLTRMEETLVSIKTILVHGELQDGQAAKAIADFQQASERYQSLRGSDLRGKPPAYTAIFQNSVLEIEKLSKFRALHAADLEELVTLRQTLDDLLDEGLQLQIRDQLLKAQDDTFDLIANTITALSLALPIVALIGIWIGWSSVHNIHTPLVQLLSATKSISNGEMTKRVEINSQDEFGSLGTAFNEMTARLQGTLVARSYLESILKALNEALFILDHQGKILDTNKAANDWLQYPAMELHGRSFTALCPEFGSSLSDKKRPLDDIDTELLRQDGSKMPVSLSIGSLPEGSYPEAHWVVLAQDVSERAKLQKTLLTIVDQERIRSGQELHDSLGQHLTGLAFIAKALEKKLQEKGLEEAKDAQWVVVLLNEALQVTRGLAHGLHPVGLGAMGLGPALDRLAADTIKLYGIDCFVSYDQTKLESLPVSIATHLYRISQEAINNAIRHGRANTIHITLAAKAARLRLRIADNGRGFEATLFSHRLGMGLQNMSLRAKAIKAKLYIRSRQGCTQVLLALPYPTETVS